jgi:hypothetical protein
MVQPLALVCLLQSPKNWTDTDLVGFQHEYDLRNGTKLFLLVEKDFVCLDNTFEDQSDNYPNPNGPC